MSENCIVKLKTEGDVKMPVMYGMNGRVKKANSPSRLHVRSVIRIRLYR